MKLNYIIAHCSRRQVIRRFGGAQLVRHPGGRHELIGGSDADREIRWFMNRDFRLALLRDWKNDGPEQLIDFTRYDLPAHEPPDASPDKPARNWSLMNRINQKGTRPQDKPVLSAQLPAEDRDFIRRRYPELFQG